MRSRTQSKSSRKDTTIQLRLPPVQKELIARAARIKQTTLTSFVVDRAYSAAQDVLADQAHFSLSPDRWREFCEALDAPPKVVPALRKLLKKPSVFHDE